MRFLLFVILFPISIFSQTIPRLDHGAYTVDTFSFAVSPDSRYLAFNQEKHESNKETPDYLLWIFDLEKLELKLLGSDSSWFTRIRFIDSDRLAYLTKDEGIKVLDTNGKLVKNIKNGDLSDHCGNYFLTGNGAEVTFWSKDLQKQKILNGLGQFRSSDCSETDILLIFQSQAVHLNPVTWEPICKIQGKNGKLTRLTEGKILPNNRLLVMDERSGFAIYENCKEIKSVYANAPGFATNSSAIFLGMSGSNSLRGGTNLGPFSYSYGIRVYDPAGSFLREIPFLHPVREMQFFPGKEDKLILLPWGDHFYFLDLKSGEQLILEIRQTGHWLLKSQNGSYNTNQESEPFLYFTEQNSITSSSGKKESRNLFQTFLKGN
ncbi:hypothetical protein [Leptospira idonii]|uniref:Uncharacterized protein n=1 Tax=Leptospira idonii TaxID=1193500 RepID=A0A4V3JXJ8_9LEPT|nr:hypothetical protein [Leptospira idonii]TGN16917.1 hypothetical protein EHS15_18905 [Leptospira idonii]